MTTGENQLHPLKRDRVASTDGQTARMSAVVSVSTSFSTISQLSFDRIDREIFRCEAGDRVFGPRHVFHTYPNAGDTDLKMILIYTPGGFEQSILDREVLLEAGKDQSEVGRMMLERYGLTRSQLPT